MSGKTYSFLDVTASMIGPGAQVSLGAGAANAKEGITIEPSTEIDAMTIGGDGAWMHSLKADKSAKLRIRFLKTSPLNGVLQTLYNAQTASSAVHGQNTIVISNPVTGDVTTCQGVAFARKAPLTYAEEGGIMEWEFNAGQVDTVLGS